MELEVQDEAAPLPPSPPRIPAVGPGASTWLHPDPSVEVSWVLGTESKKGARGKKNWVPRGMGDEDPGGSVLWKMFVG